MRMSAAPGHGAWVHHLMHPREGHGPLLARTGPARPVDHAGERAEPPSEDVRWAWGLIAMTLPAALVAILVVDSVAAVVDRSATGFWAGVAVYLAAVAPLLASIVVGLRAWREQDEPLGARAAALSAFLLVAGTVLVAGTWLG